MRGVSRTRRSLVGALAAVAVAVPVFVVATALPAGAVDVANATDLASNFNNASVTSIVMTDDITIDCGHLLNRDSANPLTLDGAGHTLTQGCANNGVMHGVGLGALTLQDITVTGGDSPGSGGGVDWLADVTVVNARITENHSESSGGGVHTEGSVVVTGSTFTSNTADDSGGGVAAHGNVTTLDSVFTDNEVGTGEGCDCSGGGFAALGAASVTRTTFLDNGAGDCADCGAMGGGFYANGFATVSETAFTNNRAGEECESCGAFGGGLYAQDGASIVASTFDSNIAGNCGNCGGGGGAFATQGDTTVNASRIFENFAGACGSCGGQGGGAFVFDATLTVEGSAFATNSVSCDVACSAVGGGAYVAGNAAFSWSAFDDNSVACSECFGGQGGGLYLEGAQVNQGLEHASKWLDPGVDALTDFNFLTVSHARFRGNSAECEDLSCEAGGGGIVADNVGTVAIDHSTLSENRTIGVGGAIIIRFGGVNATITNSTIAGNLSGSRGAVVSFGEATLTLVYDTIVLNSLIGEVVPVDVDSANVHVDGELVSVATVIAMPGGGTNCGSSQASFRDSQGYNFSDDLSCQFTNVATGDRQGTAMPLGSLGPLVNNGGLGDTMLPQANSPLLDFIPPSACRTGAAADVIDDERGVSRPRGPGCEIGAAEVVVPPSVVPEPNFTG